MKRPLLYFTLAVLLISGISCRKWFVPAEDKLEGDWKLDDVSHSEFLGWDRISTPYTSGIFHFDENGAASYTSTTDTLSGQWTLRRERSGYYDEDGNWVTDRHLIMHLFLADFQTNKILELYFDNFHFRTLHRIVATYKSASYRVRYRFDKM